MGSGLEKKPKLSKVAHAKGHRYLEPTALRCEPSMKPALGLLAGTNVLQRLLCVKGSEQKSGANDHAYTPACSRAKRLPAAVRLRR